VKKKILFPLVLLLGIVHHVFPQDSLLQSLSKKAGAQSFQKLIVKCDAKIVLYENYIEDTVRIEGSDRLLENIFVLQNRDELIINAKTNKDLKKEGAIYIPVSQLQYIEVHADAKIISYSMIHTPELNILVNGDCIISLVLKGKLNIRQAEGYNWSFRRVTENANTPLYINKDHNY
jgi:predicted component of viral defense system (DUF524 family)